jgi:hypothetical protein
MKMGMYICIFREREREKEIFFYELPEIVTKPS